MRASSVLFTLIAFLFPSALFGQTNVSGAITTNTTWTLAGNPVVIITDSVTIASGVTLTIEPGVIVKFNSGTILVVAGTLKADGTSANPITFTSSLVLPVPGSWRNITFLASASASSFLDYCFIEYGGSGTNGATIFYATGAANLGISNTTVRLSAGHGVNVRSSSPRISTSIFRDNVGYGIYSDLVTSMTVDSSTVNKNTLGGIRIPVNSGPTITNSTIDSNGVGIFIDNSSTPTIQKNNIRFNNIGIQFTGVGTSQPTISQDTIKSNTTWGFLNTSTTTTVLARNNYWGSDTGPLHAGLNPTGLGDKVSDNVDFQPWVILAAPLAVTQWTINITKDTSWTSGVIWVKNDISVESDDTLTIKPGVIVKFAAGARLTVNGMIVANGKSDSLIVFTSEKDDPYGGDTNGDGGATIASRGSWDMVWLTGGNNDSSIVNYCVFRYGGSSSNGNVRIDGRKPVVTNSSFTQSSNYGLRLYTSANVAVKNCTFGSNSSYGVLVEWSNPSFYGVTVINNGSYGIYANGNSRFTVRKSELTKNSYGIVADGGTSSATLISLDSSSITYNVNGALYLWYGTGAQTFSYNRIANNGAYGLWCFNVNDLVTIEGDTILNNGNDGIITSKALIKNNIIQGNRYPIALFARVNTTYSGNTISGNSYNNVIALRVNRYEESFSDTLKAVFPAGMTSGTYVMIENTPGWGVYIGYTFVIQPGVIIKMDPGMYWHVEGTLIADGTPENPIVFTSYRDSFYGGKTNSATDNAAPAPNDWRYIRIGSANANNTILDNVIFKYGGRDGVGNLWIENNVTLSTPVRNIISRKSSSMGIYISDGVMTFENITVDSNATYGIWVQGNRPSNVAVRNSFIRDNAGGEGLYCYYYSNSAFSEVSNCFIQRNSGWGIGVYNGTIPQTYSGNTITNNGAGGIFNSSPSVTAANLLYIGNTVTDHPNEGILSTRARYIDNRLERNRYPLAVWHALGNIYTDNNNVDGNIITGNTYNNAIAIWQAGIYDTLKATFPQAITSKTYVAVYDFTVDAGKTLVVEPGVKIKFQEIPANNRHGFNVSGTLIAQGTQANPIIFTSWRDSTVGGKTAALNDYTPPAPGDWNSVWFRSGSGASIIRYCQFKYAGRSPEAAVRFEDNVSGIVFSNNLIRKSSQAGMFILYSAITVDSTTVDSSASYGIRLYPNSGASLVLRYSKILSNGSYGVWAQSPSKISIISNSDISRNSASGVYVENNSVPLTVLSNTVTNNANHGLYLVANNDAVDTLLTIAGNKVRNNGLAGIFSSRAYVVDDSITGNRYAIGVVGQISLTGTGTANGNVYQNNYIAGNTYNTTMVTEESTYGNLGASAPPGYSKVIAVRGNLLVPSGTTLKIAPGTVIKFPREYTGGVTGSDARFRVDGILLSEGTFNNKITFTSWKDDSYGGDSNADSNATVAARGDWDMIYLNGSSNNASKIFNTIIRFGGRTNNGNLYIYNNAASVDSSFVSFSQYSGIEILGSSSSLITATEIHNNGQDGVTISNPANPILHFNNFHDNSRYGLYNGSSTTINATDNYWGHSSGPYVNQGGDQNLSGLGNRIYIASGSVTYRPFLTSRSGVLLGDVSINGTISPYDASLILRHLVSSITLNATQLAAADVSGDATVSSYDASLILQYVVGLITGFPGLGKVATDATIASAYDFKTEAAAEKISFALQVKKASSIFGAELHVAFDPEIVVGVEVQKTALTENMTLESNRESGALRIAMAGAAAITDEGELLRITFKLKEGVTDGDAARLEITKFLLNESDLTDDAKNRLGNAQDVVELPTTFGLAQNYPNPFNPTTSVEFAVASVQFVSIKVFDVLGREVAVLVNEERVPGFYKVTWNASALPSGVYWYRMHAGSFVKTHKMILTK